MAWVTGSRWVALLGLMMAPAAAARAQLPAVPVPPENPITEPKRVLGKVLFWDAQLSSDSTIACGTCHITGSGGTDPRLGLNPGLDGTDFTADDKVASPGVIRTDADDRYLRDAVFGLGPQVTRRSANTMITAQWAAELFWDGRAGETFIDPESGATSIALGGALETQVVAPPVSDVEMAHEGRDWSQIAEKLANARPLALTADVPPDVAAALAGGVSYPDLFAAAFGDGAVTAERIAFAIATYERTLVPDQTPFDLGTMTAGQQAGLATFQGAQSSCTFCHVPPLFTDFSFRNIGLRPAAEDPGRFEVTGNPIDLGRFKVPSLRNVGLKETFMHHGRLTNIEDVIDFYAGDLPQVPENQDPIIPTIEILPTDRANLADFLRNALIDPRVVNEQFPFDRPRLHTELTPNPAVVAGSFATPGSGGFAPLMIAVTPPYLGHGGFKIGLDRALGRATATVALSRTPPLPDGTLDAFDVQGPVALDGAGSGGGFATWPLPIPDDESLLGDELYLQWLVADPQAEGGVARSVAVRVRFYRDDPTQCGCAGDLDCDGTVGVTDLVALVVRWGACELCAADLDNDGMVGVPDLVGLITSWGGCP